MFERYRERKYIKTVMKYVQEQIWNGAYAREKLRAIRENIRQNYDFTSEKLRGVNDALANMTNKEGRAEFEPQQVQLTAGVEQLKANLAEWDAKIEAKSAEIKGLRAELSMLTEYISKI